MEEKCPWREVFTLKYLFVCCEGATEEAFIEKVLAPYFKDIGVWVTPSGMKGVSNY